jgi:hypothetical protein
MKILPLEDYMVDDDEPSDIGFTIGRPGFYMTATDCWYETPTVARRNVNPEWFIYSLDLHHAKELRPEQIEGLKAICRCNLATDNQRYRLYMYESWLSARDCWRGTSLWWLAAEKRDASLNVGLTKARLLKLNMDIAF